MSLDLSLSEATLAKFVSGRERAGILGDGTAGFTNEITGEKYDSRREALISIDTAIRVAGGLFVGSDKNRERTLAEMKSLYEEATA